MILSALLEERVVLLSQYCSSVLIRSNTLQSAVWIREIHVVGGTRVNKRRGDVNKTRHGVQQCEHWWKTSCFNWWYRINFKV